MADPSVEYLDANFVGLRWGNLDLLNGQRLTSFPSNRSLWIVRCTLYHALCIHLMRYLAGYGLSRAKLAFWISWRRAIFEELKYLSLMLGLVSTEYRYRHCVHYDLLLIYAKVIFRGVLFTTDEKVLWRKFKCRSTSRYSHCFSPRLEAIEQVSLFFVSRFRSANNANCGASNCQFESKYDDGARKAILRFRIPILWIPILLSAIKSTTVMRVP